MLLAAASAFQGRCSESIQGEGGCGGGDVSGSLVHFFFFSFRCCFEEKKLVWVDSQPKTNPDIFGSYIDGGLSQRDSNTPS